jgi:hypothetical protein
MFAASGIGLRDADSNASTWDNDSGLGSSEAAASVAPFGQGYLLVQSRLRVTRDGGHSILAVRDPKSTTRLDPVSGKSDTVPVPANGVREPAPSSGASTSGTSAPTVASVGAPAPPAPQARNSPKPEKGSGAANTGTVPFTWTPLKPIPIWSPPVVPTPPVSQAASSPKPDKGKNVAGTVPVPSMLIPPKTVPTSSPSVVRSDSIATESTVTPPGMKSRDPPSSVTPTPVAPQSTPIALQTSPVAVTTLSLTGNLRRFQPLVEYLQKRETQGHTQTQIKRVRQHFDEGDRAVYGDDFENVLNEALTQGIVEFGSSVGGKARIQLPPNVAFRMVSEHRLMGSKTRFKPLIRYLMDHSMKGLNEINVQTIVRRFGADIGTIISDAKAAGMVQDVANAAKPKIRLSPGVEFAF